MNVEKSGRMNKADQKRVNRCNRQRGGKFEKVGADFLDMDVVPYSGSNARFGYGDVRDSIWLGEFKNITPKNNKVTIKNSWITINNDRASAINKLPFLAWMPCGKVTKYIILDYDVFNKLNTNIDIKVEIPKKSCKAVNIILDVDDIWIKKLKPDGGVAEMKFDEQLLYMMRMELFKDIIIKNGLKGTRNLL